MTCGCIPPYTCWKPKPGCVNYVRRPAGGPLWQVVERPAAEEKAISSPVDVTKEEDVLARQEKATSSLGNLMGEMYSIAADTTRAFDRSKAGVKHDEIFDPITRPEHYAVHPSGVECITVTEQMNFCVGNAIKYLWRAGLKGSHLEDLKKARWYVDREIARLEKIG